MVRVNTSLEYGRAVYECEADATLVGDGVARCWKTGYISVYDSKNNRPYRVKELNWAYVPSCQKKCPVPDGKSGNQSATMVKVTKCTSYSFSRYPDETCENPVFYHVTKNESHRDHSMVFYGSELCVARMYTKEKYTLGSTYTGCRAFCMPGIHGYHRLVVMDSLMYKSEKVTVTRVVYKYQTVDYE